MQTASTDAWGSPLTLSGHRNYRGHPRPRYAPRSTSSSLEDKVRRALENCEAVLPSAVFANLARSKHGCPVDNQQEGAYAPVVYLKEKAWLLRAGKFCKARSTSLFCKPFRPWARCTATALPGASSKFPKTCSS